MRIQTLSFTLPLAFVSVALTIPTIVYAQQLEQQRRLCDDESIQPDLKIGACTAIIQSGRWVDRDLAWAFISRGNAYNNKGELDRAIQDFGQAIRLEPDDDVAFNNRGNAYSEKGDHDRAIEDYSHAIRLKPEYASTFYNRGVAYSDTGDHDRAIEDYNQAIRLKPNYAYAFYNRGNAYNNKGEHDRAIQDFD